MDIITRSKVMKGKSLTSDIKTEEGIFRIRQLTIGEKGHADLLLTDGLVSTGIKGIRIENIAGSTTNFVNNLLEYSCYIMACSLSLDGKKSEQWKPEDIKNLKFKDATIAILVKAIEIFSGMKEGEVAEQVKGFRNKPRGNKTRKNDSIGKS